MNEWYWVALISGICLVYAVAAPSARAFLARLWEKVWDGELEEPETRQVMVDDGKGWKEASAAWSRQPSGAPGRSAERELMAKVRPVTEKDWGWAAMVHGQYQEPEEIGLGRKAQLESWGAVLIDPVSKTLRSKSAVELDPLCGLGLSPIVKAMSDNVAAIKEELHPPQGMSAAGIDTVFAPYIKGLDTGKLQDQALRAARAEVQPTFTALMELSDHACAHFDVRTGLDTWRYDWTKDRKSAQPGSGGEIRTFKLISMRGRSIPRLVEAMKATLDHLRDSVEAPFTHKPALVVRKTFTFEHGDYLADRELLILSVVLDVPEAPDAVWGELLYNGAKTMYVPDEGPIVAHKQERPDLADTSSRLSTDSPIVGEAMDLMDAAYRGAPKIDLEPFLGEAAPQSVFEGLGQVQFKDDAEKTPTVDSVHDLYEDGDEGIPPAICDRNGQVALGLCKRCNKAEAELWNEDGSVAPCKEPDTATVVQADLWLNWRDDMIKRVEALRREKHSTTLKPKSIPGVVDYASAGMAVQLGMQALDEGIPNGQRERCEAAVTLVEEGLKHLKAWMEVRGYSTGGGSK